MYSSNIKTVVSSFLEDTKLHDNPVWIFRAASARLLGICGRKDILTGMLSRDNCYDVRAAAFTGLGGTETDSIKFPVRNEVSDEDILEALEKEWAV